MASITTATDPNTIPMSEFFATVPPGRARFVSVSVKDGIRGKSTSHVVPDADLYCPICEGIRRFCSGADIVVRNDRSTNTFVAFICRNCSSSVYQFAVVTRYVEGNESPQIQKLGQLPAFGPRTPSRLVKLIGPDKELYDKGLRAEAQGLGIAAFAYFRRVIENQKTRIFDEVIRVCKGIGGSAAQVAELEVANKETQFSKAVEAVKLGMPASLLINGTNPLSLLHDALSDGLHGLSDDECLDRATAVRIILSEFVERMAAVLSDEAELNAAVAKLVKLKSAKSQPSQAGN